MTYCIYEDLLGADKVKIHLKSCTYYVNHEPTETTKWHEVDDYKDAEILAEQISKKYGKGWVHAKCCVISTLAFKQLHPAAYDNAKMLERLMKKTKRPYRKKVTDGILDLG